jgi:hypothetical protein
MTLAKVKDSWEPLAKEPIEVNIIGGVVYAFGSELAMLRLEHEMRIGRARYSTNRKSWSYCTDRA